MKIKIALLLLIALLSSCLCLPWTKDGNSIGVIVMYPHPFDEVGIDEED